MFDFKNIFCNNTASVGLVSLGLSKKIENNQVGGGLQNNQMQRHSKSTQRQTINTLQLNFKQKKSTDELDILFSKNTSFAYKNGKIIG